MPITRMELAAAVDQVLTAAKAMLTGAKDDLEVVEIRKGVLGRNQLQAPGLAVTSPAGTATHVRALHEQWEIPLEVWSVVQTEDDGGENDAIHLALRGRSVLLTDRTLSLPFVEDVQSSNYETLGAQSQGRRVLARAAVNVRLAIVDTFEESQP